MLTAWAAGKFDAERIAKDAKRFSLAEKVNHKKLILPGHVAVLSGELEEELRRVERERDVLKKALSIFSQKA